jgi:hypothetical protein
MGRQKIKSPHKGRKVARMERDPETREDPDFDREDEKDADNGEELNLDRQAEDDYYAKKRSFG